MVLNPMVSKGDPVVSFSSLLCPQCVFRKQVLASERRTFIVRNQNIYEKETGIPNIVTTTTRLWEWICNN